MGLVIEGSVAPSSQHPRSTRAAPAQHPRSTLATPSQHHHKTLTTHRRGGSWNHDAQSEPLAKIDNPCNSFLMTARPWKPAHGIIVGSEIFVRG
jgi:hypothetical protein